MELVSGDGFDDEIGLPENGDGFEEGLELPADRPEEPRYDTIDKLIRYVTLGLTVMLLGGSLVFWFVIVKYLAISPYYLADPVQMSAVLISCASVSLAVMCVQWAMKKKISAERWLICMCVSGALTAAFIAALQLWIRGVGMDGSYVPTLICFAVSGCALPSMLWLAVRAAAERLTAWHREVCSRPWERVRRDVLALTDFGGNS